MSWTGDRSEYADDCILLHIGVPECVPAHGAHCVVGYQNSYQELLLYLGAAR
jgi:hypothetical protein